MFDLEKLEDDDPMLWIILGVIAVGAGWFLPLLAAVRAWLIEYHVLVTDNIVIPFPAGTGLDWPRVIIVAAVLALSLTITIRLVLRRRRLQRQLRILEGADQ